MKKGILISIIASLVVAMNLPAEDQPTTGPSVVVAFKDLSRALRDGRKEFEGKDLTVTGWSTVIISPAVVDGKSVNVLKNGNVSTATVDNSLMAILTPDETDDQPLLRQNLRDRLVFNHVKVVWQHPFMMPAYPVLLPAAGFAVTDSQASEAR